MTPIAIPAALGLLRAWWKAGAGVLVGVALALPVGRCQGVELQKARNAEAAAAVQTRAATAAAEAAEQRAADTLTVTTNTEERSDAISRGPDEAPSGPELRLACQRLRQQGTASHRLPAPCRPRGPVETAARP